MLLAAGWDPLAGEAPAPLLDPFCGAGTIPIEAALLACGRAPGRNRRFAFMNWPDYNAAVWAALCADADEQDRQQTDRLRGAVQILASDRDAGAIAAAQGNAERAGVASMIEFICRPVSALAPPPVPGWLVSNPPYGLRVSANRDLRNLYAQLGNVLRDKCPGWRVALLGNDRQLLGQVGLKWDWGATLVNGGIPVHLARATVATSESEA
jgi:putative N6-adenine-specific DNA methylase